MDIASLGIKIDSAEVEQGKKKLAELAEAAGSAEAATEQLTDQSKKTSSAIAEAGAAASVTTKNVTALQAATEQLGNAEEAAQKRIKAMVAASLEQQKSALAAASATNQAAQASRAANTAGTSTSGGGDALSASFAATQQELAALNDAMAHQAQSIADVGERREWLTDMYDRGILSFDDTTSHMKTLEKQEAALKRAMEDEARALQGLLRQYDPASTALKRLAADQAALEKALKQGAITQEQYNKAQAGITVTKANWQAQALAIKELDRGLKRLSLSSNYALRTYSTMLSGLSRGDMGQVTRDVADLTVRTGALAAIANPAGIAIGALTAAAIGYTAAAYQAEKETYAYHKALIMSGDASGATAGQLAVMASHLDGIIGTQAKAAEGLAAFAATGQVAARNLQYFVEVAERMEQTVGAPVSDTAKQFEELGRAPVEASKRLQAQYHYLTAEVLAQITALERQGNVEAAGELAQKTYADAMQKRTKALEEQLGTLQRAAKATGGFFKEMWDGILDVGRTESIDEKLEKLEKARGGRELGSGYAAHTLLAAQQQNADKLERSLRAQVDAQRAAVQESAEAVRETDRQIALQSTVKQIIDEQTSAYNQLKVAQSNANISAIEQATSLRTSAINDATQILEGQRKAREISDASYFAKRADLIEADRILTITALQDENKELERQKTYLKESTAAQIERLTTEGDTVGALKVANAAKQQSLQIDQQIAANSTKIAQVNQSAATSAARNAQDQTQAIKAVADSYEQARVAAESYLETIKAQRNRELEGVGQGNQAREFDQGKNQIEDRFTDSKKLLDQSLLEKRITQDEYDQRLKIAQEYRTKDLADYEDYYGQLTDLQSDWSLGASEAIHNYFDDANNTAKQTQQLFENAFSSMEDALLDFVKTGKVDFASLADSIISDILRIQAKNLIAGIMGDGSSGSNWGSLLSSLAGLFGGGGATSDGMSSTAGATLGQTYFATGGDVGAGVPITVGERGRELFVPHEAGSIVPNHKMADLGGPTVNIYHNDTYAPGMNVAQMGAYNDYRDKRLIADIIDGINRGRYPIREH